jgi:uncharacterized protein YndB with AHSA1/START domain
MTVGALQSARAVADLTEGLILATVEIAATPARVFRAISSAEIAQWWGSPETYTVTHWSGDVRPGGWWRSEGRSADGQSFAVGGEILVVEAPHLLVQTWKYEHKPTDVSTVRFRVEAIPGGARLTVRHHGFRDRADCESHANGWERVMGWLTTFVQVKTA